MIDSPEAPSAARKRNPFGFGKYWYLDIVLILVVLAGGYLRMVGIRWDEDQHLHPDERFLTMVENDISPVSSIAEYFDTDRSSLNPQNRDKPFYVYGDFPIILVRYIAEAVDMTDYNSVQVVGRIVSGVFDLLTLILVYLLGAKVYDRRVGILAAALYASSVLAIQLSHFFAVDTFLTFFITLGIYAAVSLYKRLCESSLEDPDEPVRPWSGIGWYLIFGLALGLAMSSKYTAVLLAIVLPVAVFCWFARLPISARYKWIVPTFTNLAIAAVFAFLVFRVAQPYFFKGPGFFDILPNPKVLSNIHELSAQTNGTADFPPSLQWARRPKTFAFENLLRWGMGWPMGILVWAGFLWMAVKMIRKEWHSHLPIWIWTGAYFFWQAMSWNPMMRYTLPAYPTLVIIGAWLVFQLWDHHKTKMDGQGNHSTTPVLWARILAVALLVGVVAASGAWGYAFSRIYTRPVTRVEASRWIYQNVPGPITFHYSTNAGKYNQPLPYPDGMIITPETPLEYDITARTGGVLNSLELFRVLDSSYLPGQKELLVTLTDVETNEKLTEARIVSDFSVEGDIRGKSYTADFSPSVPLVKDHRYRISLRLVQGSAMLLVVGSAPANESDWDDGLPLRIDEYDGYGGIYTGGLNFQMYWDDNEEKRERFVTTLDRADYIFISSNRQWGTTTRIPERYPMSTGFYKALLGCPETNDLLWCYQVAKPGMFTGSLGFELIQVFQSDPSLGDFSFNDQSAEESFTVYDHPKVFIFKKSTEYDPQAVASFFEQFDLARVIHVPLNKVPLRPQTLMLSESSWLQQQAGGTWSEIFDWNSLQNKYPGAAVILWYLVVFALGWVFLPMVRLAFPGLKDRGYAFSRLVGILFLALIVWLAGSIGIPFSRLTITLIFSVLVAVNAILAWLQRGELKSFLKEERTAILLTELVFFSFFTLDLLVRIGNPDIWHPYKGGEKPMDFSYLNAVIKSTTFPPYDPWYAGGYINYYYYGFVIVGVLVKWLGIVPSIAYNIILPTLFSLLATGAFSIVSNVVRHLKEKDLQDSDTRSPFLYGWTGAAFVALIGNLASIRMIWVGLQRLAAPEGQISDASFLTRLTWTAKGLVELFQGASLPFYPGDWYWIPSRAIPAPNDVEPITEFPAFTFLYADLHAHMIALPITVLVIGWLVSLILVRGEFGKGENRRPALSMGLSILTGAVAVGALRPTNTWDFPVYLTLCLLGILYVALVSKESFGFGSEVNDTNKPRWIRASAVLVVFAGLSFVLYQPFTYWFGAGYTSVDIWRGPTTPSWSFLTHWGLFLFILVSWLAKETIDWMSQTPLRKLGELRPKFKYIYALAGLLLFAILVCVVLNAYIAWIVLPLALWSAILIFRKDQPEIKRILLFFIGTGLVLTLVVEIIVLVGDIGRMNTVFKFYLQVWTLFALTSAIALYPLFKTLPRWSFTRQTLFTSTLWLLVGCASLFPLLGGIDKIRDRMVPEASHSLDGMTYMAGATFLEGNDELGGLREMQLEQDYRAIRWMQENIKGSPVIVEGNVPEYRWGTRYTIYTGLPGVVGWNWHQRQQRALNPSEWIFERVDEVTQFYSTTDVDDALAFLRKYNVKYIILGQMEMAIYPLDGLAKFYQYENQYWKPVYTYQETTVYEVIP